MNWRTWCISLWGYWLMLVIGLVLGIFDFKWEVTFGDIALGIIAAIITVGVTAFKFWLPRHPFTLRFYEKPYNTPDEDNPSSDWKVIQCAPGESKKFFIGARLRTQRTVKTIDIRMVERQWWILWKEPPRNTATVMEIRDQERAFTARTTGTDNQKGGREASYQPAIDDLPRGAIMWYEVTVKAERDWNGWLSFQLRRGSSHKGHARAKIWFKTTP